MIRIKLEIFTSISVKIPHFSANSFVVNNRCLNHIKYKICFINLKLLYFIKLIKIN